MAKYFGRAVLKCNINSKIKELKHGPVSVVDELQDERQMRKDGTSIPPPHPALYLCVIGPPHPRI